MIVLNKKKHYLFCSSGLLLLTYCLLMSTSTFAQNKNPLYETYFSRPEAMIEDEENGGYFFFVQENLKVSMSDDGYYKLMTKNGIIIEEGDTDEADNHFERHGKWIENYPNGKPKSVGNYFHDQPIGLWQLYGPEGMLQTEYNIQVIVAEDGNTAFCRAGTEKVFFTNGKIKEERFYKAEPTQTEQLVKVEDPETEKIITKKVKVTTYKAKPFGTWIYYNSDGTEAKREDK